ncbi:hypothetical protein Halru_1169 [Halovivax ruber XH-70]|uniref:Uncharacterized protein n=1 Tax=Halovivax ruber (strain DSM 18193 / JCM 13892 / XH-70) TaxID=797302 RepID=L0IC56_HALRX|nr:hypothetical protein [Halovivax ruber]AGB15786.1 hypothetical protein Halru_1169 [Halovivax ruber XH-70]
MTDALQQFDHPAWLTGLGTVVGYGIILALMTIVMFGLPYLVFLAV